MKLFIIAGIAAVFSLTAIGCAGEKTTEVQDISSKTDTGAAENSKPIQIPGAPGNFTTDFSIYSVDAEEIISGGPPKDGIPSLTDPDFVPVEEAAAWIGAGEPVILVEQGNIKKAYPLQVLMFHEIVNDTIAGLPIAVTYCPLCNTSVVFESNLEGSRLIFGTTGRLRFSNLLMYDRQSESWWQQASGKAVIGKYTGRELVIYPSVILSFEDLRERHSESLVLSKQTGYSRPYGQNPYVGYDTGSPWAYRNGPELSAGQDPMERAVMARIEGEEKVFRYPEIKRKGTITDIVGGRKIVLIWDDKPVSALDSREIRSGREAGNVNVFYSRTDTRELSLGLKEGKVRDGETGTLWSPAGIGLEGPLKGERLVPAPAIQHFWFSAYVFSELGL